MQSTLTHGSWGLVHPGCPMDFTANDGETVDFLIGEGENYFEFSFKQDALVEFIKLGMRALHELGYAWPAGR